jgi:hypothetical protein
LIVPYITLLGYVGNVVVVGLNSGCFCTLLDHPIISKLVTPLTCVQYVWFHSSHLKLSSWGYGLLP